VNAAPFDEPAALKELLLETKALRTDMSWMRERMEQHNTSVNELFDRTRAVEMALARIEGKQRPVISWPAVVTVITAIAVAALAILDRLYNK
jgi:hypothetical protein